MEPEAVIVRPLVTEKATKLMQENKYAFVVNREANKIEIRNAVQALFKVTVTKVCTMNLGGKLKRRRMRLVKRQDVKHAIVTIAKGQTIDAGALK